MPVDIKQLLSMTVHRQENHEPHSGITRQNFWNNFVRKWQRKDTGVGESGWVFLYPANCLVYKISNDDNCMF